MLAPQIIVRDTHRIDLAAPAARQLWQALSELGQATAHFLLHNCNETSVRPFPTSLVVPSSWQTNALPSVDDGIQIKLLAMNELDAVIKTFIKQKDE